MSSDGKNVRSDENEPNDSCDKDLVALKGKEHCSPGNTREMILSNISELRQVISTLCSRVEALEDAVKTMDDREDSEKTVSEVCTQTDTNIQTYADAVKRGSPTKKKEADQFKQTQQADIKITSPKTNTKIEKKEAEKVQKEKSRKHDVKPQRNVAQKVNTTSDVIKTRNHFKKENEFDLPETFIIHDSTLHAIQPDRLGNSYGVHVNKAIAYTTADIEAAVETLTKRTNKSPDAILIHVGINDIKKKDANSASKNLLTSLTNLSHTHPNSKIVISKIAPTLDKTLKIKQNLFNALISAELYDNKHIHIIGHDNLKTNYSYLRRDNIHPTQRGASVLAGNIGRSLRNMFWQMPQSRRRQSRQPPRPHPIHVDRHMTSNDNQRTWWNKYNALYHY